ncbi:DNA replication protein DciA [Mycolicibacterium smegmatis]|uniref:DNA replication protein DciA n=1 Tax=Mycolicibacterium smegmatis TaxID=1772 RepID=UPI0005D7DA74|nr:DNA replication protein DciA [Mycolicibacterium smegmatis]MDF1897706.1 DNA replication protein DciA [Mycolicibacterium smegmatis]MDF1904262.1 DNA replication protein DciA [Mycolicibacterium smegmatis]MDF1917763.1 DNA replication protein DciA [Mycolicibacterium smegmatis]MDF1923120.1 DNA replication protein DciA [Mycolicibacterium smegmatis]UAK52342.1 DNA replication protein DciA [Mycolicibacterium smegmatis]
MTGPFDGDGPEQDAPVPAPPDHLADLRGIDLVRRTLEEARGAARSQGKDVGRGRSGPVRRVAGNRRRRTWSGPGPDARDPQLFGAVTQDLAKSRGWSARVAEGSVFGRWRAVVGDQIADHATPTALNEGVLTVTAESTAWATQLRMVQSQLLAKIAAVVGDGVVTTLKIVGPTGPSWRKGRYHVSGRGPRDTYG